MGDHRLAHRGDRAVERRQHPGGVDVDLVVVGGELLGDHVGVAELVALADADVVEADAEGGQLLLSRGLGQQRDDQARVKAAGEQHADRHVGDHPALHRDPQRLQHGV